MQMTGNGVYLTRGDSLRLMVRLSGRVVADGDRALLTVKERAGDELPLLVKTAYVSGRRVVFEFLPSDTEGWKPKRYHWSLRLIDRDGNVTTPLTDEELVIGNVIG